MTGSVHLENFPLQQKAYIRLDIVENMDYVRDICNCVFSLRKEANIRVRMPLAKITICNKTFNLSQDYIDLIKQETNTKEVVIYNEDIDKIADMEIILNMKECGKMFASKMQEILKCQKQRQWTITDNKLNIAGLTLDNSMYNVIYKPKDGSQAKQCENSQTIIMIDKNITTELIMEGLARDVIRIIQQNRKDKGLQISDHISIDINTNDKTIMDMINNWGDFIKEQTLADNLNVFSMESEDNMVDIDGYKFQFKIEKNK